MTAHGSDRPASEDEVQGLINSQVDLVNGKCGDAFKSASACFFRSTDQIQGADCQGAFKVLRDCMLQNPAEFPEIAGTTAFQAQSEHD
mmetsp:Transcript_9535/g.34943  ORF Transcript_9535/g.34943 Transcript_9535/m.34943 type:complete len:88 (+) Transcript_9535:94-357(+)